MTINVRICTCDKEKKNEGKKICIRSCLLLINNANIMTDVDNDSAKIIRKSPHKIDETLWRIRQQCAEILAYTEAPKAQVRRLIHDRFLDFFTFISHLFSYWIHFFFLFLISFLFFLFLSFFFFLIFIFR